MLLRYLSGNGSKGSAEHGCCELCSRPTSTWKSISSWHPRPPDGKTPKKTIRIIVNINPQNGRIVKKKKSSAERLPTQVASTGAQTNIVEPTSRQCQWSPPGGAENYSFVKFPAESTPRLFTVLCDAWLQAFGRCWDLNHYQEHLDPRGMLQGDVFT